MSPQPINWKQWHSAIVQKMSVILTQWGMPNTTEYEWLRKAEIAAIKQLRADRKGMVH